MAIVYNVTTPNEKYSGRTYGIKFDRGFAQLTDEIVERNNKGLNIHQVANGMRELGYRVEKVGQANEPMSQLPDEPRAKGSRKAMGSET